MPDDLIVIAMMTLRRDHLDDFRRFERAAEVLMTRHGGELERAVIIDDHVGDTLRELHVVRFPDEAAFTAYREDGELVALGPLREASVIATELWRGRDLT